MSPKKGFWTALRVRQIGAWSRPPAAGPLSRLIRRLREDRGMNTAEYAVGTLAAVAFAGLLLKVLTSGEVQAALTSIIERALQ